MSVLLHLQDKLRRTTAAIGRLEAELPNRLESRALQSNLLSLRKLHQNLQHEFQAAALEVGLDVCHYGILEDNFPAKVFARAIGSFQDAFSLVYDALKNGPKSRRDLSAEATYKTELRLAYSYAGSFGVVFTLPNSKLFPDIPTYLDEAAQVVLTVGKARDDTAMVTSIAKELGRAPIAAIYDWAKANAQSRTGADIQWTQQNATRDNVIIQAVEFSALSASLERKSEEVTREENVQGVLVGADIVSRRFHFIPDGSDEPIRGRFIDAISEERRAQIPVRYTATIKKITQISYATEIENTTYVLLRLVDVQPSSNKK
ncbi:MAG TPA: hypothetical protein VN924_28870 [Bryobacteraceae bacterium]|nr:hypothetical protein [Bryobacteraceae bacterium]